MDGKGEPQPGATPEDDAKADQVRSELAGITDDASVKNETDTVGFSQKMVPDEYLERQRSGKPIDALKGVKLNPEGWTEEALRASSEKVARYVGDKLTGVDGQPLPDAAAEATIDSIRAERDVRAQELLFELATLPKEEVAKMQQRALDTLFLGVVVDQDALYDPLLNYKKLRYMGSTYGVKDEAAISAYIAAQRQERGLQQFGPEEKVDIDLPIPRLRSRWSPASLRQGLLDMVARIRGRADAGAVGFDEVTKDANFDQYREKQTEPKPPTPPQGPTQG